MAMAKRLLIHGTTLCAAALRAAGKTLVPLEGDASISRVNETNLGNYVCDAFLRSVPKAVAAKAPGGNVTICMFNAGGIRTGYKVCVCSYRASTWEVARSSAVLHMDCDMLYQDLAFLA
jgi:hypothetical protein